MKLSDVFEMQRGHRAPHLQDWRLRGPTFVYAVPRGPCTLSTANTGRRAMFHLSETSQNRLENLDPKLVQCVRRAITTTTVDFGVFEGMRSRERQAKLVREGVSRTLDSYHLTGHAVDLVPFIGGRLQWQMPACIQVAVAMREAAFTFGVEMSWGGVWDVLLTNLDPVDMAGAVESYVARFRKAYPSRHPLIDGPHFQVAR